MPNELTVKEENTAISANLLSDYGAFENAQRMAKMLMQSKLIPANFQNNLPDCLVALEIAQRTNNSPFVVMQNLNVINGTPRWSSKYVAAALAATKVTNIRYELISKGMKKVEGIFYEWDEAAHRKIGKKITEQIENLCCCMIAKDRKTGDELRGPEVSIEMAVLEGWYSKSGSKWKTMPGVMLRYRAATFFANAYYPDIMIGLSIEDETETVNMPVIRDQLPEVVQAGAIAAPQEEESEKTRRRKKTEPNTDSDSKAEKTAPDIADADFEETADRAPKVSPVQVVAPQEDDSDEWENWGD